MSAFVSKPAVFGKPRQRNLRFRESAFHERFRLNTRSLATGSRFTMLAFLLLALKNGTTLIAQVKARSESHSHPFKPIVHWRWNRLCRIAAHNL